MAKNLTETIREESYFERDNRERAERGYEPLFGGISISLAKAYRKAVEYLTSN